MNLESPFAYAGLVVFVIEMVTIERAVARTISRAAARGRRLLGASAPPAWAVRNPESVRALAEWPRWECGRQAHVGRATRTGMSRSGGPRH
mgnify:CR=1 FL=1